MYVEKDGKRVFQGRNKGHLKGTDGKFRDDGQEIHLDGSRVVPFYLDSEWQVEVSNQPFKVPQCFVVNNNSNSSSSDSNNNSDTRMYINFFAYVLRRLV